MQLIWRGFRHCHCFICRSDYMFTQIESIFSNQSHPHRPPIQVGYTVIMIYQINLSEPIHHSLRHANWHVSTHTEDRYLLQHLVQLIKHNGCQMEWLTLGMMVHVAEKINSSKAESKAPCDNEGGASAGQTLHSTLLFSDSFSCHWNCEIWWNSADVLRSRVFNSILILLELWRTSSSGEANILVTTMVIS